VLPYSHGHWSITQQQAAKELCGKKQTNKQTNKQNPKHFLVRSRNFLKLFAGWNVSILEETVTHKKRNRK